jgi:hypothetical protein
VGVKFNSSDGVGLAGGVTPEEAADTVAELAAAGVAFLEISGAGGCSHNTLLVDACVAPCIACFSHAFPLALQEARTTRQT